MSLNRLWSFWDNGRVSLRPLYYKTLYLLHDGNFDSKMIANDIQVIAFKYFWLILSDNSVSCLMFSGPIDLYSIAEVEGGITIGYEMQVRSHSFSKVSLR